MKTSNIEILNTKKIKATIFEVSLIENNKPISITYTIHNNEIVILEIAGGELTPRILSVLKSQ